MINSKKKYILFSFDHELFLGSRSGTAQECMIAPVEKIRGLLGKYKIKGIFFTDITYLCTLKKYATEYPACANDLKLISDQLLKLVGEGHYVYPHIHPHWLDAEYLAEHNQFSLANTRYYRFHNLPKKEKDQVFIECLGLLSDIIHPVYPDYKINAFRAGGWSIQPFSDFAPYFKHYGIEYDFSVLPGLHKFTNAQYYDYSRAPRKAIYRFNTDVNTEAVNGPFIEVSNSIIRISHHVSLSHKIINKVLYRFKGDHTYRRGSGQQAVPLNVIPTHSMEGGPEGNKYFESLSGELMSITKLPTYLRFIHDNDYVQFVSHPKMLSDHNLKSLSTLIRQINNDYEVETDFKVAVSDLLTHPLSNHSSDAEPSNTELLVSISVVIPCYNVEKYIEEGLRTVLNQTEPAQEIICVDDGSTDSTVDIIRKVMEEFPGRITLILNETNRGATYSRNRGLAMARSEYIQFFDADDLLLPEKFEYQRKLIVAQEIKPDILVSSCKKIFLDGSEKVFIYQKNNPWINLIEAMLGVTTSNLFRREKLLEVNGWSENLKSSQEYDLMFRMLQKNAQVLFDQEIVSINRERESGSITKSNPAEKWKRFINLRTRIFDHLKASGQLTDELKQVFVNNTFDSIRILYYYNPELALELYHSYIAPNGRPQITQSTGSKYMTIYRLAGFRVAQYLSGIKHKSADSLH